MRLLIISEGKHELDGALETIVQRLIGSDTEIDRRNVRDPALKAHHSTGKGYFKKAIRCLLYAFEHQYDAVVLVIDQDREPDRQKQFAEAQAHVQLCDLPRAMGVAVVTFDAWMLADEQALSMVLGQTVQRQPDPEPMRDPKHECEAIRDRSHSNRSLAKLYAELAQIIDLKVLANRCPSGFGPFADRVRAMADQLKR